MAEEQPTTPTNGAAAPEPKASLREIAEASWDEVQDDAEGSDAQAEQPAVDANGQPRDARGRFAPTDQAARPGEAEAKPSQPRPEEQQAPDGAKPVDPALGSNQPPQHWPEQVRQDFAKLDPWGQKFLLERHTEMERFAQSRVQAAATAVQFTQALAPYFQDPNVAGSMQQQGITPFDAITQLLEFQRRAADPDPAVRRALHQELGQRMGLDPAANGQMSRSGNPLSQLSEADLRDPAIKAFADSISRTFQEQQALWDKLAQIEQRDANKASAEVQKATRWQIDQIGDEKDASGNRKRPYFDDERVMAYMLELLRANPERDLQQTYDEVIWAIPEIRAQLIAAERNSVQQQHSNSRARQAVRSNVRGITSPVSKPAGDGKKGSLRDMLEASADEVGL